MNLNDGAKYGTKDSGKFRRQSRGVSESDTVSLVVFASVAEPVSLPDSENDRVAVATSDTEADPLIERETDCVAVIERDPLPD